MADPSSAPADRSDGPDRRADTGGPPTGRSDDGGTSEKRSADADGDIEALRREVEEKYDFDDFGPADMAEMSLDEWEAAFDPDSWIVGTELLDRVERDLKSRIAARDVFAVVERTTENGEEPGERVVAYSDEGYAIVYPDGSVEGRGTVLRDVKPTVALCSMDDYEVGDPPADFELPSPEAVAEGTGELGNTVLQAVAGIQLLAGLAIMTMFLFTELVPLRTAGRLNIIPPAVSLFFIGTGLFLFLVVANARLSDRFRAEEYRNRLRALGVEDGNRPAVLSDDGRGADAERPVDDRETADG